MYLREVIKLCALIIGTTSPKIRGGQGTHNLYTDQINVGGFINGSGITISLIRIWIQLDPDPQLWLEWLAP
jgi:hypothetical protein